MTYQDDPTFCPQLPMLIPFDPKFAHCDQGPALDAFLKTNLMMEESWVFNRFSITLS